MALIRNNRVLWTVQVLLAALFLFAGGVKLFGPAAMMAAPPGTFQFPILFLRFIGLMEVLGAFGLILPALTGIKPQLTALAAWGLVVIMIGATVISAVTMGVATAVLPLISGVLAVLVASGRGRVTPERYATAA